MHQKCVGGFPQVEDYAPDFRDRQNDIEAGPGHLQAVKQRFLLLGLKAGPVSE